MTDKVISDGSTAAYYELPPNATEIQELVSYKDMNGQVAEIFRTCYRYSEAEHSEELREARKMLFYSLAEVHRIVCFVLGHHVSFADWFQLVRAMTAIPEDEAHDGDGLKDMIAGGFVRDEEFPHMCADSPMFDNPLTCEDLKKLKQEERSVSFTKTEEK